MCCSLEARLAGLAALKPPAVGFPLQPRLPLQPHRRPRPLGTPQRLRRGSAMSDDAILRDLWEAAAQSYKDSTKRSLQASNLPELNSTDDLLNAIEKSQHDFASWRNKHPRLLSALKNAMLPVDFLTTVAQTALSVTPFAPASAVLGASLHLMHAAGNVTQAYDWVEELFERLGDFTQRLKEYIAGNMAVNLQKTVTAILTCLIEILGRSEKLIRDGRFKTWVVVNFLGKDEKVTACFDRLTKLVDQEEKLVMAMTYATSRRVERKLDEQGEKLDELLASTQEASTENISDRQTALLERALQNPAIAKNYQLFGECSEDLLENSGQWLFDDADFQEFFRLKTPLVWVQGGPGTGKSCLSAATIQRLKAQYPQSLSHPSRSSVCYFYIKENDQDLQDLSNLLKTIAHQISLVDSVFKSHAVSATSTIDKTVTARDIWNNLFVRFYGPGRDLENHAIVVVDGLDEAPRTMVSHLFDYLAETFQPSPRKIRLSFIFFGRPEIAENLNPTLTRLLRVIEIEHKNQDDIKRYITKYVGTLPVVKAILNSNSTKAKKTAVKLGRKIRVKLLENSDAMFFKVVLIMEQLKEMSNPSAIFDTIDKSPPGLHNMISQLFQRLAARQGIDLADLKEILLWLSFSRRPLRMGELYVVLRQRAGGMAYMTLKTDLTGKYASLFKITDKRTSKKIGEAPIQELERNLSGLANFADALDDDSSDDDSLFIEDSGRVESIENTLERGMEDITLSSEAQDEFWKTEVRFRHASIKDYLVYSEPSLPSVNHSVGAADLRIDSRAAEFGLAMACIRNMLQPDVINDPSPKDWTIHDYAGECFIDHFLSIDFARTSADEKAAMIRGLVTLFYSDTGTRHFLIAARNNPIRSIYTLFGNTKFVDDVRKRWLAIADKTEFDTQENDWIGKAIKSRKDFFVPLSHQAARLWLEKSGHDDPAYCELCYSALYPVWVVYKSKTADEITFPNKDFDEAEASSDFRPPSDSPDYLEKMANDMGLQKTCHWHASLGRTLSLHPRGHERAISHFKQALRFDERCWAALQGLAQRCAVTEDFTGAVQYSRRALDVIPVSLISAIREVESEKSLYLLATTDLDSALADTQTDYSRHPDNDQALKAYIRVLYAQRSFEKIVEVVDRYETLEGNIFNPGPNMPLWDEIGIAFRSTGQCDRIKTSLEASLSSIDFSRYPTIHLLAAYAAFKLYDSLDDVMNIMAPFFTPHWSANMRAENIGCSVGDLELSAIDLIGMIFLTLITQKERARAQPLIDGLRNLAVVSISYERLLEFQKSLGMKEIQGQQQILKSQINQESQQNRFLFRVNSASLRMGAWLRDYENVPDAEWKPYFRPMIKEGIDMLTDDDPFNDQNAYYKLVLSLIYADDIQKGLAAAAALLLPSTHQADRAQREALADANFVVGFTSCSGLCNTAGYSYKGWNFDELHMCSDCYAITFCSSCLDLVKRDELPFRICSSEHEFVQIFPVPESAKGVAAVWDGKAVVLQKEWLDVLKKKWEL